MEIEQLKDFTSRILAMHKRIIKPWKKSGRVQDDETQDYAQGWNDCLKEIEKNHKKFMAYYDTHVAKVKQDIYLNEDRD